MKYESFKQSIIDDFASEIQTKNFKENGVMQVDLTPSISTNHEGATLLLCNFLPSSSQPTNTT
ncbi:hypothetical protein HYC85_010087 [Camellia sinensis]|uniref:Uncharacterized protein n=1 Tax=Camellia sinensis TaxID=4442 RepID=A0A7J7HH31_CAMSI|nr:hypothetical protein HYC85_010087 [Camellia sinensis]